VGYFISHGDFIEIAGMLYFYNIPRDVIEYNIPGNINKKYNITQISDCCRRKYLSTGDKKNISEG